MDLSVIWSFQLQLLVGPEGFGLEQAIVPHVDQCDGDSPGDSCHTADDLLFRPGQWLFLHKHLWGEGVAEITVCMQAMPAHTKLSAEGTE